MAKCNLIIDSCCDLPPDVVDREGIYLLKFPYILDGESYDDDLFKSVSAHEFYEAMRKGSEPSTSQLSIPILTDMFERVVHDGVPTVYLAFTSGLSGSFSVSELVRDQIKERYPDFELYVIDSHLASVAEGLIAYEAINQRDRGLTAKELADWALEAQYFVDDAFMVEDLKSLHRGGRIPASVAVAGSALDVKPLLTISVEGTLTVTGVARGRKKAIKHLADYYESHVSHEGESSCVVIGGADCPKDLQRLKEMLLKIDERILIIESNIGPVIGSHVGPGMLAEAFWGANDKRENLSVADRIARRVRGGE